MAKNVKVELDHDHEDLVYLKTDPCQYQRMVVEIRLLPGGIAIYKLRCGEDEPTEHYAIEISDVRDDEKYNKSQLE
jgi:hypothetical protein